MEVQRLPTRDLSSRERTNNFNIVTLRQARSGSGKSASRPPGRNRSNSPAARDKPSNLGREVPARKKVQQHLAHKAKGHPLVHQLPQGPAFSAQSKATDPGNAASTQAGPGRPRPGQLQPDQARPGPGPARPGPGSGPGPGQGRAGPGRPGPCSPQSP